MALAHSPKIVTAGLRASFDPRNLKSYPGSGGTLFSLNATENATASTISMITDAVAGTTLDHKTSTQVTINLSPFVNHEAWSVMLWVKSSGITEANYRTILRMVHTGAGGPGYFYIIDTREINNCYVLGYQRDYNINDWLTVAFNNQSQWTQNNWWCIGVSHDNKVFKSYRQGILFNTQTQTRNTADYTDISTLQINTSSNNKVYMGPMLFYDRVLSDDEFAQNHNALRGRFGL